MRLTLERMHVENFKGCRQLDIDFNADRTAIAGANGTGKTTIVDAFTWAIWNQDSHGNAPGSDNFREKPLDENGQPVHNLDTTVELFCTLDGNRFDIKRTQSESWVKKRGNAEATFQGNVSTYWINGVETKLADFKARIKAIADDEVMRLIGSLSAFNLLEWRKRRQQLLNLADTDVDGELLSRDEYRRIADEIAQRNISPDDLRKVLADQRKAINNELKLLPVRIDEAKKSMPQFEPHEVEDAEYIIADTKKDIESVEQQIIDARAQSGEGATRTAILALEQECISIKRRIMDEHEAARKQLKMDADIASANFKRVSEQLAETKLEAELAEGRMNAAQKQVEALRTDYMDVKRKSVVVSDTCPTCGQQISAEKMDEARKSAEANKRSQLLSIQQRGKQAAVEFNRLTDAHDKLVKSLDDLKARSKAAQDARDAAMAALKDFPEYPDEAASRPLEDAERRLEAAKAKQSTSPDEIVRQLTERKRELLAIVDRNLQVLTRRDVAKDNEIRIKAYEARQTELGAQLSETEIMIVTMEKFVQDRCAVLEDSINSHFPTVRWKLFDTQINGGITDACMCMIDCDGTLVPYDSANTAAKINADIEIVNVLSEHYDIRIPLFVDNSERVNVLADTDSQLITLAVSTDEKLTVKEA